ncbi:MAG TPA: riboflavin synthase [Steroidobacteraceae bacterium]
MFTGIVRGIGRIVDVDGEGDARRLAIETGGLATGGWQIGDSVAVAGVCLTVVTLADGRFEADLSGETLRRTTLGRLGAGKLVNLEPAVLAAGALGGHLVTGHVDGIARVGQVAESSGSLHATIEAPPALARYIAAKGSVTLDGVSLTVSDVSGVTFGVDIVPHTRAVTTLGNVAAGQPLNLEVDLIARYLERLLEARGVR